MKLFNTIICLFISGAYFSQKSEELLPKEAVTVFSINNFSLLQKVSLDDLVRYEFMEEIQQELFDGSTSGRTLKDSGIDFDQKLNIFYGEHSEQVIDYSSSDDRISALAYEPKMD